MPPPNERKTNRDTLPAVRVFTEAIANVIKMGEEVSFKGAVDVGVTFKSVTVDRDGLLSILVGGNDTRETNTQIQLATRVHLDK